MADCLSRWAYPAGRALMDISGHADADEMKEAIRIVELEKAMEEGDTKCFVLMASKAELSQRQGAAVPVLMEETSEKCLMAPIKCVESVLMEDLLEDYAAAEHWSKYWNAVSAPSDDEWPEGLTEDEDKLLLNDREKRFLVCSHLCLFLVFVLEKPC